MKYRRYLSDPALARADWHCQYCGKDLLGDFDSFLSFVRDHVVPRSRGGADGSDNRVIACAACDRLKADADVADIAGAVAVVAAQRASRQVWFERIKVLVRG